MERKLQEERRKRIDRRTKDLGVPEGLEERRLSPERRRPEVQHMDFDEHIEVITPIHATQ